MALKIAQHPDVTGCITNDELAELFEQAFGRWRSCPHDARGRRETPRVLTREGKSIFAASCAYDGRDVTLNRRAEIVDISADGLGIVLPEPLPVGAIVCFAFDNDSGERNYGVALVVRSARVDDGHRIGLVFTENARSLEVDSSTDEAEACPDRAEERHGDFHRLRKAAAAARRVITQRGSAQRTLRTNVYDKRASFIVEAKLFRFTAALWVEGKRIVRRSGMLRDRLGNLFCDAAIPTLIHLKGGGFSAWATMQANAVTDCRLGPSLSLKQQFRSRVAQQR